MGVDSSGINRGACTHPGCTCVEFQNSFGANECFACIHPPASHKALDSPRQAGASSGGIWQATRLARGAEAVMDNDDAIIQAFLTKWTKNPQNKPQPAEIKGVFHIDNPALKSGFDQYCATLPSPNVG